MGSHDTTALMLAAVCLLLGLLGGVDGRLPETNMTACQMAEYWGYVCEEHSVTTSDGYILGVQRLPPVGRLSADTPIVFLQHGLLGSADEYLWNLPHQSLGYILADANYDVWLGNARGNTYSQRHTTLNPSEKKFWDFSWEEMSDIDTPAVIDYVLGKRPGRRQVYYVGTSQGTLTMFAKLASDAVFKTKIKAFFALAPIYTVGKLENILHKIAPYWKQIYRLTDTLHAYSTKAILGPPLDIARKYCIDEGNRLSICERVMFGLLGKEDLHNINRTRLPVYLSKFGSPTSMKNIVLFGQNIVNDETQAIRFDYGLLGNVRRYKQAHPTQYNISRVDTYVVAFHSSADQFADPADVMLLLARLKVVKAFHYENYSHLDFSWANDLHTTVFDKIVQELALLEGETQ